MRRRFWAWFAVVAGCLLAAPAAVAAAVPAGPVNLLLVGIDPRNDYTAPLADSIIVAHIPADRSGAVLFSLPRDLVVRIPAFAKSGSPAQRAKINAAMALGSRIGERKYSAAQGFELLAQTVSEVTGIRRFDAGAVLNFGGFRKFVDAVGGISVPVDQDVVSEHRKPDGSLRDRMPQCPGHDNCHRPYIGAQKAYPRSDNPVHFTGWEALDFCRQRYGLPRSDYDRQRHQRQFVKALAKKLKRTVISDPARLAQVTASVGSSLTFVGGGRGIADWAQAMKVLRIKDMTGVGLPGSALFEGGVYQGEQLPGTVGPFFTAVAEDRVASFLRANPGVVIADR
ncbi:hypothetical protein Acy02nite_05550 [Actinoplanes cyaneus]|uniref:Cell envelope-related transcriptional attenuator domain-containing protein n=1 Tax=Actinoplanes cyaneus TaxID=52696 RepID=A0A919M4U4_9ACTN|nr:LCP family protein [Actinoplanes cyaneus]MCW2135960.1 transcriptional attenuator, LytR family [Actinoplanes cyaneus]GID62674.1 hypothetical protein Acy02nite_05550 [Actinoplanes cyaneus]